jgi:hypothetical protein
MSTKVQFDLIQSELEGLQRKMGVLESNMMTIVSLTGSPSLNPIQTVQELVDRAKRAKDAEQLEKKLQTAERKLREEQKEARELKNRVADLENKQNRTEAMVSLMNTYLQNLFLVTATPSRNLLGSNLFDRYLEGAKKTPELAMVIQVLEDYGAKYQQVIDDALEAIDSLRDLYNLVPVPDSPCYPGNNDMPDDFEEGVSKIIFNMGRAAEGTGTGVRTGSPTGPEATALPRAESSATAAARQIQAEEPSTEMVVYVPQEKTEEDTTRSQTSQE